MSVWDLSDMVDDLKRHYDAGCSASEIAKLLGNGISRNAVIGKIHRIGVTRPEVALKRTGAKQTVHTHAAWLPKELKPQKARVQRTYSNRPPKPTREANDVIAPRETIKETAWIALKGSTPQAEIPSPGHCKWPIGTWDEGDRFYCCNTVRARDDGKPSHYCVGHHDMGYDLTDTRAKRARALKGALWAARSAA